MTLTLGRPRELRPAASTARRRAFPFLCALLLAAAVLIPFVNPPYIVQDYTRICVVALPAIGLSLLTGYGGLISLGQGAFFGIGAYTTAILVADYGWAWWATLPLALVLAFAAGMLVGAPALRIRGVYLAIITLVLGALFPAVVMRFGAVTGGNQGKPLAAMTAPPWLPLAADQFRYLICLFTLVAVLVLTRNLTRGQAGRALVAMRDDESAAALMGVDVARTKVALFGISAALAGLAGSLFAATHGIVSSETAYVTLTGSIQFLSAIVIGGATSTLGPVIGAAVTERLPDLLSDIDPVLAPAVYGGLLVVVVLVMRDGLAGLAGRVFDKLVRRKEEHR
ncbi:branched-chain amino acid ABC transporter permease [Nonomuraea endophytica]|uniref:branched-chain amino acid ABC transporter permease n=1 Tax=Nonomuraea endophytica TaxID=714136 RepID=UPI0037C729DD